MEPLQAVFVGLLALILGLTTTLEADADTNAWLFGAFIAGKAAMILAGFWLIYMGLGEVTL